MGHVTIAGLPAHRRLAAGRALVPHGGKLNEWQVRERDERDLDAARAELARLRQ